MTRAARPFLPVEFITRTEISLGASSSPATVVVVVGAEVEVVDEVDEVEEVDELVVDAVGSSVVAVVGTVVVRSGKLLTVVATAVVGVRESGETTVVEVARASSSEGNSSGIPTISTQKINMRARPPSAHLRTKSVSPL